MQCESAGDATIKTVIPNGIKINKKLFSGKFEYFKNNPSISIKFIIAK